MKRRGIYILLGIIILFFLLISYFIRIRVDYGANFITYDSLLGIIIFHSPIFLGIYAVIAVFLILIGLKKSKERKNYKLWM